MSKTAMLVGAGAVSKAWDPVVRAMQKFARVEIDPDQTSCLLARIVYLARFFANAGDGEYELLVKARKGIAEELKAAEESGEILVRDEFESIVNQLVVTRSTLFYVISTNWDKTVDTALSRMMAKYPDSEAKVFPLHGTYDDPSTLYLPTEMVIEPYRSKDEEAELGGRHAGLMSRLGGLEHLVVYGLSLDPSDAELNQIVSMMIDSDEIRTIDIVDLEPELVAKRISLLMKKPDLPEIRCIRPAEL